MLEINISDPDHDWDKYESEDLVTAKIVQDPYITEDGKEVRINLDDRVEAEKQLSNRLSEEQKERRREHKNERARQNAQTLAKHFTGTAAMKQAAETLNGYTSRMISDAVSKSGVNEVMKPARPLGGPVDIGPKAPTIPHSDMRAYTPAPNRTPEQLDRITQVAAELHSEALVQTKELQAANAKLQAQVDAAEQSAKDACAEAKAAREDADAAHEEAKSAKRWTVGVAIAGILVALGIAAFQHIAETPAEPAPATEQPTEIQKDEPAEESEQQQTE